MVQHQPAIAPDRVKFALTSTARPAASDDAMGVGAGEVDAYRATFDAPPGVANQGLERSSGMGSLDASRGTVDVRTQGLTGVLLEGDLTAQLLLWDAITYTTLDWTGSNWDGSNWHGSNWHTLSWYGSNWHGSNWHGSNWHSGAFYGSNWHGSAWYGAWS